MLTERGSVRHALESRGRYPRSRAQTPWTRRANSAPMSTAPPGGGTATVKRDHAATCAGGALGGRPRRLGTAKEQLSKRGCAGGESV